PTLELDEVLDLEVSASEGELTESEPGDPTEPMALTAQPAPTLELEDDSTPSGDDLTGLIRELGLCDSPSRYTDIARRVVTLAERAFEADDTGSFDRVVHAVGRHIDSKHESGISPVALKFLDVLVSGRRLDYITKQATEGSEDGVLALQTLLHLGDDVVAHVVTAAATGGEREERDRLIGVILALGDRALPTVFELMGNPDAEVVRTAVRIAGDTQHPAAVPRLSEGLHHESAGVREDTGRALVRIGSDEAIAALARAARGSDRKVAALGIQCLAATANARALPPLEGALGRAVADKDADSAKEIVRALGRMGIAEAAGPLVALLDRNARMQRWLRDLKVAAISALGSLPGDQAVGALAQAAQSRDAPLRRAAETALDRRAGNLTRT
ncbi:MAG: HEAT repeat domain-containing protein, partial [Myxococcota bacterium]